MQLEFGTVRKCNPSLYNRFSSCLVMHTLLKVFSKSFSDSRDETSDKEFLSLFQFLKKHCSLAGMSYFFFLHTLIFCKSPLCSFPMYLLSTNAQISFLPSLSFISNLCLHYSQSLFPSASSYTEILSLLSTFLTCSQH